jgi:cysteine synthase
VIITPNAAPVEHPTTSAASRAGSRRTRVVLTDQFCNPANVRVHAETTAVEILEQTGGRIGAFVAGAGTGGTISGVGRCLKRSCPAYAIVLADPVGSGSPTGSRPASSGRDGSYAVEGIGGSEVAGQPAPRRDRRVPSG